MIKNIAVDNFLGRNGVKKLNCALSVLSAFKDKFKVNEQAIELFKNYGGGNAPGGLCGAYYAVIRILEQNYPDKPEDFKNWFIGKAGCVTCKELKKNKVSCIKCIEIAAEFLEKF